MRGKDKEIIPKSGLSTFNCNCIIGGITIRETKIKVLDIQLHKGIYKLWKINTKVIQYPRKEKKKEQRDEWKKTLSLIDFQKTRVISSPASGKQCFWIIKRWRKLHPLTHDSLLSLFIHSCSACALLTCFILLSILSNTHQQIKRNWICNICLFLFLSS